MGNTFAAPTQSNGESKVAAVGQGGGVYRVPDRRVRLSGKAERREVSFGGEERKRLLIGVRNEGEEHRQASAARAMRQGPEIFH